MRSFLGAAVVTLAGCAAVNEPINATSRGGIPGGAESQTTYVVDDVFIGLAFSGGGTRASSFSYGMLQELQANGLLKYVRLVSGVSGGSVTAAYYGLTGPRGMKGYRERYLIKDAETYMANNPVNPVTIAKGLSGGANDRSTFARFLDETLFHNATFKDLHKSGVETWINASDVANNTPFLFSTETFAALCSDLTKLPVSEAVAASAAFPLVFAPIVLESHQDCNYREPDWLTAARNNPEATSALRAYGKALESYRDPDKVRYVKLLDGAVTDNFGTTGLSVARAKSQNEVGPLTPKQAVRMRRMMFLVANAGVQQDYKWTQEIKGPGGVELAMSIANSSMGAATRVGFDVMRLSLDRWHNDLVEWRCSLSLPEVKDLRGSLDGWDCQDVKLFVGEVNFDPLPKEMRDRLDEIPTRLKLPEEQVDLAIAAARQSTRLNAEFNGFLRSLKGAEPVEGARRITPKKSAPVSN
ncbi:patatin-like phospholipase family protein [Shimia aestuarii]|uniref:patatin-like phospholipase family protein n=1 Tax=Shimia aestuarii TaxID=254406 RepID=UPI0013F4D9A1|nr:patatin-like phospholipase family protein [Shimia aestuarii]